MLPLLHLSDATRNAELVTIDCGLTASQEKSLSLLLPTSLSGRLLPSLLMRNPMSMDIYQRWALLRPLRVLKDNLIPENTEEFEGEQPSRNGSNC